MVVEGLWNLIRHECDKCGAPLGASDTGRFVVKWEIYAAASPVELDPDAMADPARELGHAIEALEQADPDEVEDRTYRAFRFDVCDECRRKLLAKPLG